MNDVAAATSVAAYHPHLLRCNAAAPLPLIGTAVFGFRPEVDKFNRLVYSPLGTPEYYRDHATLAESIRATPGAIDRIQQTTGTLRDIQNVISKYVLNQTQREELNNFGREDARSDLQNLWLGDRHFLGITVRDNLSEEAREWWSRTGVLQTTTCVKGVVSAVYFTSVNGPAAFDVFPALSTAAWNMDTNRLEPWSGNTNQMAIGIVLGASVDTVRLYVDVSRNFTPTALQLDDQSSLTGDEAQVISPQTLDLSSSDESSVDM